MSGSVLPVDLGLVRAGEEAIVVSAGKDVSQGRPEPPFAESVVQVPVVSQHSIGNCLFGQPVGHHLEVQPIAVAVTRNNLTAIQSREPAELVLFTPGRPAPTVRISLSNESKEDIGHKLFHMNSGAGIACASCHPEGGEDGRTWNFACIGPRRTQSLQFGLAGTAPFHWDGDMKDFSTLMNQVFVGRMSGGQPNNLQLSGMKAWLDTLRPAPRPAPTQPAAIARGQAIFLDAKVGCASCHSGPKLTNNVSVDVGTSGAFQVPSLIGLADRAPYMHHGCAKTLRNRF
ncbi:MAG: hypothetical protein MJE77_13535 [Proteobacteria bacterium]|nr:hypothetical protein [Pseudomonadota bacterium]